MNLKEISISRLFNQQITRTNIKQIKDLVHHMGAIQAQDYNMMKWAIGVRLPGTTVNIVENALDNADIIRTHLLRPTWHVVSSKDIYWMLELTAPQIKKTLITRHKELGITEDVLIKCNKVLEKALSQNSYLTREELVEELGKIKIVNENNRVSHLLLSAELDGLICSGILKGNKRTYALLEDRVPEKRNLNKSEALAELANRYFTSHGPATIQDFIWWSGLSVTNAKIALESIKSDIFSETINSQTYWFRNFYYPSSKDISSVYLLPAYDEFLISYKDRGASISIEHNNITISNNGIFKPTIVINGQVSGIWKPTANKNKIIIEVFPFILLNIKTKEAIMNECIKYGNFLNRKIEMVLH